MQDHKEKLFVGVDEYDAPINSCLFSTSNAPESHLEDMADLFKTEFFTVMKRACGNVIKKYWLTGVLPVFREGNSPLTTTEIISMQPQFRGVCGLTEKEVQTIAENYLCPRFTPDELLRALQEMKRGYNGYQFSPQGMNTPETLYNPQLVFIHLHNLLLCGSAVHPVDDANATHCDTVLKAIKTGGDVTVHDLLTLMSGNVRATVMTEFGVSELHWPKLCNYVDSSLLFRSRHTCYRNRMPINS